LVDTRVADIPKLPFNLVKNQPYRGLRRVDRRNTSSVLTGEKKNVARKKKR